MKLMAIEARYLTILKQVIDIAKMETPRRLRALCLSYPDLLVSSKFLEKEISDDIINRLPVRPDSKDIWSWHGLRECQEPIFETEAFFDELNISLEIIDIVAARGNERIVDLNEPLPDDLRATFDIVIDTGTCEHCFNVGQAFKNSWYRPSNV